MTKVLNEDIDNLMEQAILDKNERLIKKILIRGMQAFLDDPKNYTKEWLDNLGSMYLHIPIQEKWPDEFKFTDSKLRYVLKELSAIEVVPDKRAKENVKRFILYLEDKEYE